MAVSSKYRRSIPNLVPGQVCAVMNDGRLATVLRRLGTNLYLCNWAGREVEMRRSELFPKEVKILKE